MAFTIGKNGLQKVGVLICEDAWNDKAEKPIYALTPRLSTQRKMALYRNVRPLLMDTSVDRDTALEQAEGHLLSRAIVQSGDVYAITCGEPMGAPGGTNMLKICRVA